MNSSNSTAFWLVFFSITLSEIFDKTFFIVILLCLTTKSWLQVFLGSYVGLMSMTTIICFAGNYFSRYISKNIFQLISSILFFMFSIQTFYSLTQTNKKSSCDEAEEEIKKVHLKPGITTLYPIFFKTLISTILSELGDKSQMASFMLSSTHSFSTVLSACLFAYAFCISLAILIHFIGKQNLKETYIQFISGVLFLFISIYSIFEMSV